MLYAQVANGKNSAIIRWPLRYEQLGSLINVSLPTSEEASAELDLEAFNIFKVPEADVPAPSAPGKKVILVPPTWVAGKLQREFSEETVSQQEMARSWKELRAKRDAKLRDSDWSQMVSDVPPNVKSGYAVYRQALRDLPETTQDPNQVTWPELPQ